MKTCAEKKTSVKKKVNFKNIYYKNYNPHFSLHKAQQFYRQS